MAGLGQSFVSEDGETVDRLVWRALRTREGRAVERVLAENTGLAALGAVLPAGTVVRIPVMPEATEAQQVRLWD